LVLYVIVQLLIHFLFSILKKHLVKIKMATLAEIFSDETTTRTTDKVTQEIRELAVADLLRAILKSNRNLIERYEIDEDFLKSDAEIELIVKNTESTVYRENGSCLTKYLETILTYILFLTDSVLSEDAVIFRFLVNIDINDLYINPDCAEVLFADLAYTSCSVRDKYKCFTQIVSEIQKRVPYIRNSYLNNQNYMNSISMNYSIKPEIRKNIIVYRDKQLENIFKVLIDKRKVFDEYGEDKYLEAQSVKSLGSLFESVKSTDTDESLENQFQNLFDDSETSIPVNIEEERSKLEEEEDEFKISDDESSSEDIQEDESSEDVEADEENSSDEDESDDIQLDEEKSGEIQLDEEKSVEDEDDSQLDDQDSEEDEDDSEEENVILFENEKQEPTDENIIVFENNDESSVSSDNDIDVIEDDNVSVDLSIDSIVNNIKKFDTSSRRNSSMLSDKNTCPVCESDVHFTSYKTPVLKGKKLQYVLFCCNECMEKWNI
jgi:hypothetical protein